MIDSPPDNPFGVRAGADPMAPWHMWGGSVSWDLRAPPGGVLEGGKFATQVARINYRRPDTWAFFFGGRILAHTTQAESKGAYLNFDVISGVGRTAFDTRSPVVQAGAPAFVSFFWQIPPSVQLSPNNRKYTTQARSPLVSDLDLTSWVLIDRIVGQDIQIQATLLTDTHDAPNSRLVVEATAMLAPLSHIRPDWFSEGMQFRGAETEGT